MEANLDFLEPSVLFSGTIDSAAFQGPRTPSVMAGGRSLHINAVINLKPFLQPSARLQLFSFSVGAEEDNYCDDAH